ncbi:TPA: hypothetical protein ACF1AP_003126 [Legionella pneumophila]
MTIDHVDNQILKMIVNGCHVNDIAEDTKSQKGTFFIDSVT